MLTQLDSAKGALANCADWNQVALHHGVRLLLRVVGLFQLWHLNSTVDAATLLLSAGLYQQAWLMGQREATIAQGNNFADFHFRIFFRLRTVPNLFGCRRAAGR